MLFLYQNFNEGCGLSGDYLLPVCEETTTTDEVFKLSLQGGV